jgi:hypothetical protein
MRNEQARDRTGRTLAIGDKVRTPDGTVMRVCAIMIHHTPGYRARDCEWVPPDTPVTIGGGQDDDGENIVWGT